MESHANHLKVEVKEEAVEEQVRSLTLPSSSQQAARVGSSRVSTEDVFHYDMDKVKEEDVGVKDEPLQDQDDLSVNTTTFCPKPRSRPEGLIDKKNIMKGRLRTVKGPLPLHHGPNTSQLLNVRSIKRESAGSSRYCNASPTRPSADRARGCRVRVNVAFGHHGHPRCRHHARPSADRARGYPMRDNVAFGDHGHRRRRHHGDGANIFGKVVINNAKLVMFGNFNVIQAHFCSPK